jgi:hypothetical protein
MTNFGRTRDRQRARAAGTLAHVADVMAPGGFLCFYDFMDVTPALFWGLSEQCWGFEDERDFSLWCSFPRWNRLLTDAGFEQARAPAGLCSCPG